MARFPNPVRKSILLVALVLAKLGLVDHARATRTVNLAWPRIITGIARMSKTAVDIAMVGIAVGPTAIAGLGFAGPYWGLAFTIGGGLATGTIALVSQRYGANAFEELGQAVRTSVFLVTIITVLIAAVLTTFATGLIDILTNDPESITLGATYLSVIAFGVPFAGLNLVAGRILIGADDAYTPMVLRATGAVLNIILNAILIFGLNLGVTGAALGTVLSNVIVTGTFTIGLLAGRLPLIGALPVRIDPAGRYVHTSTIRDLVRISTPVIGRNLVWTGARFPMLAFVAYFGPTVVAAYVISRRIWGLLNTPGWGFSLAASSLVGQSLGQNDETTAERYGHEITRIAVVTYGLGAGIVLLLAEPIVLVFVNDPVGNTVPVAVNLVYAASLAVVFRGIDRTYAGALDATGDTRWPMYSRALGFFGFAVPLVYIGATTSLGLWGLYLAYFAQSIIPSIINYYRFTTGKWKQISRQYRPDATLTD